MKVSLNVAQYYSNVNIKSAGVDEVLHRIGAQLGAVEEVTYWGPRYDGIVVAKVVTCEKHPNADKLHVCRIDDGGAVKHAERGDDGLIQVVCGAPNVKAGLTVAWIPPNTTVPSTLDKDPFVLEAREIRGEVSNGMLASPAELGISDNHDGILEISVEEVGAEQTKPGTPFKQLYGLDDVIIDCENKMFTHRPDCFGILGVARELAGIQNLSFTSPDWYLKPIQHQSDKSLDLVVKVEDSELVPRFMAVAMTEINVGPSPIWMQAFLTRVGIKPINNIVDLTNYYSQLTGQPTHAYDYDKVAKLSGSTPTLIARQAKKGEKIALLNGKTVEFDAPTIMIATDKQVIGVGGVMGGSETEVDKNTKNIIIECANFDMYNIRRTSMKYGLFTDAVTRFTKGQSLKQNDRVLAKIVDDVVEQCGGVVASDTFDLHTKLPSNQSIKVTVDFINHRLGSKLKSEDVTKFLRNTEFEISESDTLTVEAPFWRTDIELAEDIVEEVGRMYGFDKLPITLPKRNIAPTEINKLRFTKSRLRNILAEAGANEVLTYSFAHGDLLEKVGQDKDSAFKLSNALSPDLQYYRLSLLPSLLDKVHSNIKSGYGEFAIFEINKSHCNDFIGDDELPIEEERLALVFAADDKVASSKYYGSAYYQAKKYLEYLLSKLGIEVMFEPATTHEPKLKIGQAAIAPFERKRSAYVKTLDGKLIAELGEFKTRVRKNLKLPKFVAGFELDVLRVLELQRPNKYKTLSRFPSTEQDISLQVASTETYDKVFDSVWDQLQKSVQEHGYEFSLSPVDIYQSKNGDNKHITLRVKLNHHDRTLVTDEVNALMDSIAESLKLAIGATRL